MSETPATVVPQAQQSPAIAPGKPLNAIQLIEQQVIQYFQQKEQAIANVHALEGAIQAGQQMLQKLKAAEAEAKELAETVAADVESGVKEAVAEVENKVISIETAAKKL